jgi:hypothetical protein
MEQLWSIPGVYTVAYGDRTPIPKTGDMANVGEEENA